MAPSGTVGAVRSPAVLPLASAVAEVEECAGVVPRSLHVPTAVVAAVLTAATVNVVQFPVLELDTSDWYEAVRVKPGHDLDVLLTNHFPSTQERYTLYMQLRELTPGVRVVVPNAYAVYDEHLRGLGAASAVRRIPAELTIDADAARALGEHVVASGEERGFGPYAIALPDGPVEELVVVQGPEQGWIVARSLLDEVAPGVVP